MGLRQIIKSSTSKFRRSLIVEIFMNLQSKITKISDDSVMSAFAGGISRVAAKAEKDIFLSLATLFPDMAYGSLLDQVAKNFGIAPRFTSQGSSTYIRITATPGTTYTAISQTYISTNGIVFHSNEDITISNFGYAYLKVSSTSTGSSTNVDALTINNVSPQPNGHINIINEVHASGGYDNESDETFKIRIENGANILAKGTLLSLEQVLMLVDKRVLKIYHHGINELGKTVIAIATQNGSDLNRNELNYLLESASPFFGLSDYKQWGRKFYGVVFKNIQYQPIDVSFRVELDGTRLVDDIRKDIQIKMGKSVDYRYFDPSKQAIEWDNLLEIVKSTQGIKYVPDQFFFPKIDIPVALDKLPRFRGFIMMNLSGTVLSNSSGTLNPIYYPAEADFNFTQQFLV